MFQGKDWFATQSVSIPKKTTSNESGSGLPKNWPGFEEQFNSLVQSSRSLKRHVSSEQQITPAEAGKQHQETIIKFFGLERYSWYQRIGK